MATACLFTLLLAPTLQGTVPSAGADVFLPSHEEVAAAYAELAAAHPDLVSVEHVGSSREERVIEALRIAGPELAADAPAILVVSNLSGARLFASGVALHEARRLADGYAEDEAVKALLDGTAVYVIAAPNPDAAEARFHAPLTDRARVGHGVDDDRDGRQGEDPPADVNGDGLITMLRVRDPEGTWRTDPDDPRLMVEADRSKGERGEYELYPEGRDADGDEDVAEDAVHDTCLNANFPAGWEQHEAHAGLFPGDEPEARALMDFCLLHPALVLVLAYDELDTLVDAPKTVDDDARPVKRVPPPGILKSDGALLEELGRRYREATESTAKGSGKDAGSFQRWAYEQRGLIVLSAALWELPTEVPKVGDEDAAEEGAAQPAGGEEAPPAEVPQEPAAGGQGAAARGGPGGPGGPVESGGGKPGRKGGKEGPSDDAKRLKWIDATGEGWRFDAWEPYEHPELGACEIGGFAPYAPVEPPQDERQAIADRHFAHLLTLAGVPARVSVPSLRAEALDGGLWKVTAVVENDSFLPLLTRSGLRTRTTRPARVRLELPDGAEVVAGPPQWLLSELPGSGGRAEQVWLVRGADGDAIGLSVDTDHAGDVSARAEVVR